MFKFTGLEGKQVALKALEKEHSIPLFECSRDPEIWTNYPTKINTIEDMDSFIEKAIEARERGDQFPYVVFDKERDEIVGTTRFLRISEENNNLNIGSTWYSSKVWRTRVNTETKYLMLKYGFESLNTNRIEIITTIENKKSQRAIERLGAIKEGILRRKYNNMDYVIYSIIESEWKDIKTRLEGFLSEGSYETSNGKKHK
ncbi:GNAT family N-acetyltransferase [Paenibacillus endoradicis]|uniref:GNAT family N-acetyltransferase n=1 Tax=Paenibacillus endoradicis TaxID=2972487 RepID=UPI00215931F4|nr:GNAT family protein [Paenibacillus endoradicis]MCR8656654.1 GNAT family N-acetyltransferase [Paenibacillus endoradicis]